MQHATLGRRRRGKTQRWVHRLAALNNTYRSPFGDRVATVRMALGMLMDGRGVPSFRAR